MMRVASCSDDISSEKKPMTPPLAALNEPSACCERSLAHAGAAGEHDKIGRLQPAHAVIEIAQTGGDAGKMAIAHISGVGHVDRGLHRVGEAFEAAIVAPGLGKLKQAALGILDLIGGRHIDGRVIGDVDHVLADRDQRAAGGEIVDGAAVIGGVDDVDGFGGEASEIMGDGHVADLLVGGQEGFYGHRVGHLAHADELGRDLVYLAVQRLVKMAGFEEVRDAVEGVIVDQDRAEQRLFGLDVVGRLAIKRLLRHAELARCLCHFCPRSRLLLVEYQKP
jgi:hypothetical protein